MTRDYALLKLLEHGGLKLEDMMTITRWPTQEIKDTIARLLSAGRIKQTRPDGLPGAITYALKK